MVNLSKVMYKTYIKPVWFLFYFWENITIVSGEHCFVYLQIDILHKMNLKLCDNATGLIDQILLFLLNDVNVYIMKSNVPWTPNDVPWIPICDLKEC